MTRKTIPAKSSNVTVIKSARVPAKQEPPPYAEFDRFAEIGDKLARQAESLQRMFEELEKVLEKKLSLPPWLIEVYERDLKQRPHYEKLSEQFQAMEAYYSRDELWDNGRDDQGNTIWQISRAVVSEQMALLIGSFPNAGPHSPEVYTKMLLEEVVANNPHPIGLEGACRWLRREKIFVPTISEVLKAIDQEGTRWSPRWEAGSTVKTDDGCPILWLFDDVEGLLADVKAKLPPPEQSKQQANTPKEEGR